LDWGWGPQLHRLQCALDEEDDHQKTTNGKGHDEEVRECGRREGSEGRRNRERGEED